MKLHKSLIVALALGLTATSAAWAHGGGGGLGRPGVRVGPPVVRPGAWAVRPHYYAPRVWAPPVVVYGAFGYPYGPAYYGPGPYYGPSVVPVPVSPPVYVEQQSQPGQTYWYWCENPEGYYPTVTECPAGWQAVMPQPPAQP